ncbi:hypothetical protein DVJ77_16785 [Dyella tabacisoli]|uniref:Uncharacterized protein n=2 Tax=Dyella tabacisoli TaxID=2282381 RepID=A0A369UK94_9GAMM|nr:hypothetical protein DVJ77_16785 [Dyella tabacisoli]
MAGDNVAVATPTQPIWLVEQPYAGQPLLTARTYGDSTYGDYHVHATLQLSCRAGNPSAGLEFQIAPQPLGFDSDPYEGPDASAHGPLLIGIGTQPAVSHGVSGRWADAGVFQVGNVFIFDTEVRRSELAYWVSDASRGQTVRLSLTAAKAGGKLLTAQFTLPRDNTGLKKAVAACLDAKPAPH